MNKKHFILVTVDIPINTGRLKIENILNKALDWIEISPSVWVIWSSSTSKRWLQRFQTALPKNAVIFISELNLDDSAGALPSKVWKFISEKQAYNA